MVQRVYKNGFPFTDPLPHNIRRQIKRVTGKKAALIIVEGGLGEGKTTESVHMADFINKEYGFPPIDLDGPQMALGGIEFLKKVRLCFDQKLPVIVYDEAGDFSKRGSLTNFNAMLNRTFETFRAFRVIVILALPDFNVLDGDIFDKNIPRMMLRCRGRNESYGNYDGYSLYRMQLIRHCMKGAKIKNYAYIKIKPNFKGHFLDLEPERSAALDRISTKNKLDVLRKSEVKIEGLMGIPELATKLSKSVPWVRAAIRNLGLKPARCIKKIHYFDQNVVNELAEHDEDVTMNDGRRKGNRVR